MVMKIIIIAISLIVLLSMHAFADTYAVTLDAEQDAALAKRAEEMKVLPDDFLQGLVADYFDGLIDEEIRGDLLRLSKDERRAIARQYLKKNKRVGNDQSNNKVQ
jgi:hypothetical protein